MNKIKTITNNKGTEIYDYVRIPVEEYTRLKRLQEYFEGFWNYFEHLQDIKNARDDIKAKKVISQEEFFKKLGV